MTVLSAFVIVAVVGLVLAVSRTVPDGSAQPLIVAASIDDGVIGQSAGGPAGSAPAADPVTAELGAAAELGVSPDWAREVGGRTGIPVRALVSYAAAAVRLGDEQPACGLSWPTLAGIGAVESHHGTFGGTHVEPDGRTADPIIGIALDGGPGVAAIGDTDGGALDGDTVWDRAVGPMQFIPSTWRRWGADGNGDGVSDVHNLDDVALAAGRYLCADGGDLSDGADWQHAVLTYNRSAEYAAKVLETANGYARASWS
ncbi:murein transglycosylase [Jiangella ureilytica]|uniref:Murein transglycosylase n=1 Tax=Jiangella ureilytica TaxID=2530374 RepID=A0A4R4RGE8_9ACTN|nr:lytic murein transglycosylase [Jiangella ureilytica]TDC48354.1 murein transglycosylase [Jiangella ureilytica]